jgi:hypothetical protein
MGALTAAEAVLDDVAGATRGCLTPLDPDARHDSVERGRRGRCSRGSAQGTARRGSSAVSSPAASAAIAQDPGHALGATARSGRRARAFCERATPACSRARASGASGKTGRGARGACAADSSGARWRQEPPPDRPRPQRQPDADRARRRAMVAVDRTRTPPQSGALAERISGAMAQRRS